jgi:hypothetical protein
MVQRLGDAAEFDVKILCFGAVHPPNDWPL